MNFDSAWVIKVGGEWVVGIGEECFFFQMGLQGKKSSSQEVEGILGIKMWNCARSTSGRAGGVGG